MITVNRVMSTYFLFVIWLIKHYHYVSKKIIGKLMEIEKILSMLDGIKPLGNRKWKALCPVHKERTPSFSIGIGTSGNIVCHCFGCGANAPDVINALGLSWDDFMLNPLAYQKSDPDSAKQWNAMQTLDLLKWECMVLSLILEKIKGAEMTDSFLAEKSNGDALVFMDMVKLLSELGNGDQNRLLLACDRIIDATNYARR